MNPATLPVDWAPEPSLESSALRHATVAASGHCSDTAQAWSLQRRCALTPRQLATCYAGLVLASGLVALVFWLQGVRLIAVFSGVEVLVMGIAFALHALHAADGERLSVQGDQLLVERRRGLQVRHERLPLSGLRVAASQDAIELWAGGRSCAVGQLVDGARRRRVQAELRRMAAGPVPVRLS
jgi:uncharacterized membrane protein